jgi:NAD-dependent SIR2 family protein deacetylase
MSWERTLPQLRKFVEEGGTLITIGDASAFAERLSLPVTNALTSTTGSATRSLGADEFYIPVLCCASASTTPAPIAFGFEREADVFFDTSPAFRVDAGAASSVRRVAWFASATPLRSGWAWGQEYLEGTAAIVDAPLGRGHVLIFGPEVTYRAQSTALSSFCSTASTTRARRPRSCDRPPMSWEKLAAHIRRATRLTVLTGAGISAGSGRADVPWRGRAVAPVSPGGSGDAVGVPPRSGARVGMVCVASRARRTVPAQSGHDVLARWSHERGCTVVTQNVDDLHHKAGTAGVIRLHGSLWELRCAGLPAAGRARDRGGVCADGLARRRVPFAEMPPRCPRCNGLARPAIVWFGEALRDSDLRAATAATRCDLFIAIGTSAIVHPAAGLLYEAKRPEQ